MLGMEQKIGRILSNFRL